MHPGDATQAARLYFPVKPASLYTRGCSLSAIPSALCALLSTLPDRWLLTRRKLTYYHCIHFSVLN